MGAQRGRDVVVRIGDGADPESFSVVAGVRSRTIALRTETADATTAESVEGWRVLLTGSGPRHVDVAGAGAFVDAASDARMREAFFAGEAPSLELVIADFGVLRGRFAILELAYSGDQDGEALMSLRLRSAGAVSFSPVT